MNRRLRKNLAKLLSGRVTLLAGARLTPTDRTAFVQRTIRPLPDLADHHALLVGGTRRGKSGALELIARASLARLDEGISAIDPHGAFVRAVRDWCANPENGQYGRRLHYLDPSSPYTFGLNPLRTYDASWEACHDAAVSLASVIESRFEASPEETPRLARIVYVAAMLCARYKLTMLELVELLSIGGEELRRSLLQDFDNRIVARELEDLHTLAARRPSEFLSLVESTKNRFVRWLGDRRLARILGQRNGLDPLAVMDAGEIVLADFSSLTYPDAALLGCLISSMYFAAARRRPPLKGLRHRLILDEAESLITSDVARMCDQSAKQGLLLTAAIQRLGQLRARGDFVADALLTNCALKICFGGLEPDSARYMAETLFPGHLNLAEWKPGSERPTAVGNDKVVLRNRSRASHHAEHLGSAVSDMRSSARMVAASDASIAGWGSALSRGTSTSYASTPPDPFFMTTVPLSQNAGSSAGRTLTASGARSRGRSLAQQSAHARGTTIMRARAHGESLAEGEHEAMVTRYQDLPSAMYTLEEQLHRATALMMNLPRRECVIKLESGAPYLTRTPDLTPAFKSEEFRAEILPRYIENAARRSRYLVPSDEIDAEIAARVQALVTPPPPPEADFAAPEPAPTILDDPDAYARGFHQRRGKTKHQAAANRQRRPRPLPRHRRRHRRWGQPAMTHDDARYNGGMLIVASAPRKVRQTTRFARLVPPQDRIPQPFRVTERVLAILAALASHRFLSTDQLARLDGGSPRVVAHIMRLLHRHGFVDRPAAQAAFLSEFFATGQPFAGPQHHAQGHAPPRRQWPAHRLPSGLDDEEHRQHRAVPGACAGSQRNHARLPPGDAGRRLPAPPGPQRATPLLHRCGARERVPLSLDRDVQEDRKPFTFRVIPDRLFSLVRHDGQRWNFALEIDRGTETLAPRSRKLSAKSTFAKKVAGYFHAWKHGKHAEMWNFQRFRCLTITTSEARLKHMLDVQRAATNDHASGLFLYSTRERIEEHGVLGPAWRSSEDNHIALVRT